jgi:hypothetical protein
MRDHPKGVSHPHDNRSRLLDTVTKGKAGLPLKQEKPVGTIREPVKKVIEREKPQTINLKVIKPNSDINGLNRKIQDMKRRIDANNNTAFK